jgi:hypothetical protein
MEYIKHRNSVPTVAPQKEPPAQAVDYPDTPEGRRARRRAALDKVFGMWKGRTDIPTDGLEYQRMMRDEWR